MCAADIMPGNPGEKTVPDAVNSLMSSLESTVPAATTPASVPLTYKPGSFNVTYYPIGEWYAYIINCLHTTSILNLVWMEATQNNSPRFLWFSESVKIASRNSSNTEKYSVATIQDIGNDWSLFPLLGVEILLENTITISAW